MIDGASLLECEGAGHMVHMPAHIYMRTGNYQGAVVSNAKSAAAAPPHSNNTFCIDCPSPPVPES